MHFRLTEISLFLFVIVTVTIHRNQLTDCLFISAILHEDDILAADYNNDFVTSNSNFDAEAEMKNSNEKIVKKNFKNSPGGAGSISDSAGDSNYDKNNRKSSTRIQSNGNNFNLPYDKQRLKTQDNDDDNAMDKIRGSSDENAGDEFINDSPSVKFLENRHDTEYNVASQQMHSQQNSYNRRHPAPDKLMYTREIKMKQGRLMGIVRNMHPQTGLRDVDQFLGLPYAEAPVGNRRFMPPGAPLPWQGLKVARHLPPVCPQQLPDITNTDASMSKGRHDQLIRLLPYLKVENEDCLYLNVYAPRDDGLEQTHQYPVIAYIHGESFNWNSGNPYDGSVLASYGQVIVVTINYRLGVLGFMKPGVNENTVSNFGLLDQIAALHWIKENIASFGGDKNSVTLMGHSTGAACVNYLMVSPVASGLFHRAILMSGSAMADWAASNHSLQLTMQIAHGLNCPLNDDNDEMLSCLRKRRYQDILKLPTSFPQFSTSLGPIVDGHVIPNQPYKVMGQYTELFSRYDLLFGITEVESYHTLGSSALDEGLREGERDNLLRTYMQSRFEIRPDLALAATLKKYTDMYNNPKKASSLEHRDVVLDILSDARVVGPLLQTGLFHADVNPRNYMYVFGHNSAAGAYATLPRSISGEELAFIFGAPLAPAGPFHNKYSAQEKLLSEAVMSYWSNFAKTGNPKAPWRGTFINLHALEWDRYDIDWPEFNKRNQCYVNIGIPPSIGYKYRQIYMNFWNKELPDEINQIAAIHQQPFLHAYPSQQQAPRSGTSVYQEEIITGQMNKFAPQPASNRFNHATEDPLRTLQHLLHESSGKQQFLDTAAENMYNAPPTFGVVHESEGNSDVDSNYQSVSHSQATATTTTTVAATIYSDAENEKEVAKSESTIQLLSGLIVLFLILNVIIYSSFLMQKKKKTNTSVSRKLGILSYDGTTDDELKRSKQNDGDDSYILDMVRKTNTYEAIKANHSPINGYKISHQLSNSTVDMHTKVTEWISHESNGGNATKNDSLNKNSSKKSSDINSDSRRTFLRRPQKVSVAIDATPQARSDSILNQEPIEVTKLHTMDKSGRKRIICQEVNVDEELLRAESLDATESEIVNVDHKHSRSDPVEMYYTIHKSDEKITSFIIPPTEDDVNINVTSCDDNTIISPLTPEQQLYAIKRRNFPKVLPNYPCDTFGRNQAALNYGNNTFKRNSLPPNSFMANQMGRLPPTPPPRTISTLGRRPSTTSTRRQSYNLTTSPVMLAQDYAEEEEPEITLNTLIVGPIIPKCTESNYSTVQKKEDKDEKGEIHEDSLDRNSQFSQNEPKPKEEILRSLSNSKELTATINEADINSPSNSGSSSSSSGKILQSFESKSPAEVTNLPPLEHHTEAVHSIQPPPTDLTSRLVSAAAAAAVSAFTNSSKSRACGISQIAKTNTTSDVSNGVGSGGGNSIQGHIKSNIPRVHYPVNCTDTSRMTSQIPKKSDPSLALPPLSPSIASASTGNLGLAMLHHYNHRPNQLQQQQTNTTSSNTLTGISRIPQLKANLNSFQPPQLPVLTTAAPTTTTSLISNLSPVVKDKFSASLESATSSMSAATDSFQSQTSSSSSSSTKSSSSSSSLSSDATSSSTGTVRTELKHKNSF